MDTENLSKIEKLHDVKQWTLWKFQIKIILKSIKAFEIVEGKKLRPSGSTADNIKEREKWDDLDMRAQRIIVTTVSQQTLLHLVNCSMSKDMWEKLLSVFEQKSETSVHFLQQKFFNAAIEPDQNIITFISHLEEIVQELKDRGENISDSMVMTKILMSLPPSFAHFHSAWDSTESEKKSLDNLRSRLMLEEKRTELRDSCSGENALFAKKTNKKQYDKNPKPGKCRGCFKGYHWRRDCPENPSKSDEKPNTKDALCCQTISEALIGFTDKDSWYLDSGAIEHMSSKREYFRSYALLIEKRPVRIGNGDFMFAIGVGDINVVVFNGEKWLEKHLASVLHVPELHTNLFSQGSVLDKGGSMISNKSRCEFMKDERIVAVGMRENGLYKMLIKTKACANIEYANVAKKCDNIQVWHERLVHQNIKQVKNILRLNKIDFVDAERLNCVACILGKAHRLKFPNKEIKSKACGEVICADLCGPVEIKSVGGSKYYLLIKDEFSRYRTVFFIKEKSEVPDLIKKFITYTKIQFGHTIKVFRTDNGTEFINGPVKRLFDSEGIRFENTVPYTPEQNGLAEREMRTTFEAARTMLHARNLKKSLWAEAVNTAVFVLNRTGTSTCVNKTPYELWCNKEADIKTFKVFGEPVYAHIPKQQRKKLDKKANEYVFVGYGETVKGFRVFDAATNTVKTLRDVYFLDKEFNQNNNVENKQCDEQKDEVILRLDFDPVEDINKNETFQNDETIDLTIQNISDLSSIDPDDTQNDSFQSTSSNETTMIENTLIDSNNESVVEIPTENPTQSVLCDLTQRNVLTKRLRSESVDTRPGTSSANFSSALLAWSDEPDNYDEAMNSKNKKDWIEAMNNEYESLIKNNTWVLVDAPKNEHIIDNKWVSKVKEKPNGEIDRFKARLVARGFTQTYGVNFF